MVNSDFRACGQCVTSSPALCTSLRSRPHQESAVPAALANSRRCQRQRPKDSRLVPRLHADGDSHQRRRKRARRSTLARPRRVITNYSKSISLTLPTLTTPCVTAMREPTPSSGKDDLSSSLVYKPHGCESSQRAEKHRPTHGVRQSSNPAERPQVRSNRSHGSASNRRRRTLRTTREILDSGAETTNPSRVRPRASNRRLALAR